jgi:hypothetical protein
MTPLEFLKRAVDGRYRIVSSGDLTTHQIADARARGLFFVDEESSLGWALLPWELRTPKDKAREDGAAPKPITSIVQTQNPEPLRRGWR